jgi:hypothetical protein
VTRLGLALRTKSLNDELRLADVSLRSAVLTDSLTGLANRRAAEERLRILTGLARVGMGPVSMILADTRSPSVTPPGPSWRPARRVRAAAGRSGRAAPEQHARGGHRGDQDAQAPGHRPQGAGADGVPRSRPRRVSMTGVTGWLSANPWIQVGMVSMGTKALEG